MNRTYDLTAVLQEHIPSWLNKPFGQIEFDLLHTVQLEWSAFLDKYNDDQEIFLPVFGGWLAMFITYWSYGLWLLFFELELHKHPMLSFGVPFRKFQPNRPAKFEKTTYNSSFARLAKNVLFNWFVVIPAGLYFMQKVLRPIGLGIYVSKELPSLPVMVFHAIFGQLFVEIMFFHSHWLLHHKLFYGPIHKVHHEFKAPYGLCSIYAHWAEALIGNTFAVMGAGFLVNLHVVEWWIAGMLGWIGTNTAHSGLDLPWARRLLRQSTNQFGLNGYTDFHDYHHEFFRGNYGNTGLLDWAYGTDIEWKNYCKTKPHKTT